AYFERRARLGPARAHLPRSLGDVLAHAVSEPAERTDVFGTDLLALSEATRGLDAPEYRAALEQSRRSAGPDGIDKVLAAHDLDLLVAPAMQPAWPIDHVLGDHPMGCAWGVAAIAGYPSATLPMGAVHGLPVGLALLGPAWSEALLLRVMAALERVLGTAAAPVPRFARHTRLLA
ncbi:MAG: amidase, partial [Acidimicrobiales bacterium]